MPPKKSVSFADTVESTVETRQQLKRAAVNAEDDDDIFKEAKRSRIDGEPGAGEDAEKKSKHTLDSDEEDEEKYEKLDVKEIDGQEDSTIDYDGNIKITAFNMNEEEEDGHFDASGNFIFNKTKEIKDAWLDDIDWASVKQKAGKDWQGEGEKPDDDENGPAALNDIRRREIFARLAELLKPSQSITKAMAELKKTKGLTAAEERKARWAAKKANQVYEPNEAGKQTAELSALADELLSAGHMDCYEWPREKIQFLLNRLTSTAVDELDMFADTPTTSAKSAAPTSSAPVPSSSTMGGAEAAAAMEDEVIMWEYKEEADSDDVHGPFNSSQMAEKQANDTLGAKAVVRKVGAGGPFNPAARVDFDLYV